MLIFPDIRPFVEGREAAIAANWNDRAQFEDIRKRQLDNLFNAVTFDDRVREQAEQTETKSLANLFSSAANPYRLGALENQMAASDLSLDQAFAAQPGTLANITAQGQAMQKYAAPYYMGQGEGALQTQIFNQQKRAQDQANLARFQELLRTGQISQEQYNQYITQLYAPQLMQQQQQQAWWNMVGQNQGMNTGGVPNLSGGIESALTSQWGTFGKAAPASASAPTEDQFIEDPLRGRAHVR